MQRQNQKNNRQQPSNNEGIVVDLTSVFPTDYQEGSTRPATFICDTCIPETVLIRKLDDIEFLGAFNKRFICPRCGKTRDLNYEGVSDIKRSEELHTIVGGNNPRESTITPNVEVVANSDIINKPKGTLFMRETEQIESIDPEPREEEILRNQGFKILKKTIKRADGRSVTVTYGS